MLKDKSLSVLFVASECFPLIKTGGLADVVGALPIALAEVGVEATVFLPGFPAVLSGLESKKTLAKIKTQNGKPAKVISGKTVSGVSVLALDVPHLFNFKGNPYLTDAGHDRAYNGDKFALFSKIAADIAQGKIGQKKYDVLHAHDWQAGLTAAYLKAAGNTQVKKLLTIHNLAFQGLFPKSSMERLGLPANFFSPEGLEYWDKISFLKAGIAFSDHITTVSPTYAMEIQSDDGGMGFGGLLRAKADQLTGILNGIDLDIWNPKTDPELALNYGADAPDGKFKNKQNLQKALGLRRANDAPLFTVISRLTTQKGLDLLVDMTDFIVSKGGQLALLGSGDKAIETAFVEAAKKHPTEISATIGYDEPFAHRLQAGADAIFIPSRFEPCGLTQLCAMRYGTVPIVGRVGGLNDTVIDASPMAMANGAATGVQFSPINSHMLFSAISRTFDLYYTPEHWNKIVQNCLNQNVGWAVSAQKYKDLYKSL